MKKQKNKYKGDGVYISLVNQVWQKFTILRSIRLTIRKQDICRRYYIMNSEVRQEFYSEVCYFNVNLVLTIYLCVYIFYMLLYK